MGTAALGPVTQGGTVPTGLRRGGFVPHDLGSGAQWPKRPWDIFPTVDLDHELFGQGLCCVYL